MTKGHCFQCEAKNPPEQLYCGQCGSSLVLRDYISAQVNKGVADATRDRDILEKESSIKVFERALQWAKLTFGLFAGAVGLVLAVILGISGWKAADFLKSVDIAKQSVQNSANAKTKEIQGAATESIKQVQLTSQNAVDANRSTSAEAVRLSGDVKRMQSELKNEASSVRSDVDKSKTELEAVHEAESNEH